MSGKLRTYAMLGVTLVASCFLQASFATPSDTLRISKQHQALKTRGEDSHILAQQVEGQNPSGEGVMIPSGLQPSHKGGAVRGDYAVIKVDNFTGLYVKVYLGGRYQATVAPYGESGFYVATGAVEVYARADYQDGHYSFWEPEIFQLKAGQTQVWKLTE